MVDKTKQARARAKRDKQCSERLTQQGHVPPSKSPTCRWKQQQGHIPDIAVNADTSQVDDAGAAASYVVPWKAISTFKQEVGERMDRKTIEIMDKGLSEDIGTELEEDEEEEEEDELVESETEVQPAEQRERKGVFQCSGPTLPS